MDRILDDRLLDGAVGVERHLRVPRFAWSLPDYKSATDTIELMCEQMGGVSDLLMPEGTTEQSRPWYARLAETSVLDGAVGATARRLVRGLSGNPYRRPPALVELGDIDPQRRRPIHVALPTADDRWHLAYLAAFGALAESPNTEALAQLALREDLTFDDSVDIRRMTPVAAGADDLAARLTDTSAIAPLYMSLYRLTRHPVATNHSWALDGWLDDAALWARTESAAIIVVYTPADVADLCLAWNLRAAHGWGNGMPLAVPNLGPDATAEAIAAIVSATTRPGWRPRVNLVSESVDQGALNAIAAALAVAMRGRVFGPDQLLVPATPPSRTAATTVVAQAGVAAVPTRTDHDRTELSRLAQLRRPDPDFALTVTAHREPVVECPLLRAGDDNRRYRQTGGGPALDASADTLATVHWPSGWTQLAASCRTRGVTATPSEAGRTAMALLGAIGDIWQMRWLAHRPLLVLLYGKASSQGLAWWKARANRMAREVAAQVSAGPDAALEALQSAVADVAVSRSEDTHTFSFSELSQTFGNSKAAKAWLDWAEARGLIVRGVGVRCPHCGHRQWRPMTELAPPLTCAGCARADRAPFPHSSLTFAYRISEPLRRAIENDSIYHLLIARSLLVLLDGGPVPVVGVHPGVDLALDDDAGQRAEADVLVLFADGSMVPVEVKRSSHWFTDHDLQRLDAAAGWLAAKAVIVAACEPDVDLADTFLALKRHASPVRRLLSADDFLDPHNVSTMERTFPGPGDTGRHETAEQSDAQFCARLLQLKPAAPVRDPVAQLLTSP